MRYVVVFMLLSMAVFACKDQKKSMQGDETVEAQDFIEAFPETALPFAIADTALGRFTDTTTISPAVFTRFVPDSVIAPVAGKEKKVTIRPLARFTDKEKETYLVADVSARRKEGVYLLVFDRQNKFSSALPLVEANTDQKTITSANIDKRLGITIYNEWKRDDVNYYRRQTFAYNNMGTFTLVLNETNDLVNNASIEINPLDTFPQNNKFSGDYYKGKTNFISLRDGKNEQTYQFYVHFENNDADKCSGELKGEMVLTGANTAIYRESGDPCVIDFDLTGNQVKVREQGSCGNYRGIKCFFNDTYTRRRDKKPSKK